MLSSFALGLSAGVAVFAALVLLVVAYLEWERTREAWRPVWWAALALTALAPVHWLPSLVGAALVVLMLVVTGGGMYNVLRRAARETKRDGIV